MLAEKVRSCLRVVDIDAPPLNPTILFAKKRVAVGTCSDKKSIFSATSKRNTTKTYQCIINGMLTLAYVLWFYFKSYRVKNKNTLTTFRIH